MTIQVSQIQFSEPSLLENSSAQTRADNSFQVYLEEEQKRLSFLFSPFAQIDFYSWFQYPDFSLKESSPAQKIALFSDLNLTSPEIETANPENSKSYAQNQALSGATAAYFTNQSSAQNMLQDLLLKTGWLIPNLEAQPFFYQAELEGKLLNKLDLQLLVDQILSQIKMVKEKGKAELTLALRPENLGEILLTLTSRSGMISIQIQASEETRKLIESQLIELELALKRAKVNLAEIKIVATKEVGKNA